ncbi:polysaccharide biosynthesis/export family protein [Pontivivens ytuae]|uniref:polysaccharide biosynthesis/export family protein n=1 Tax=Pontivivens ytuae TaxID=2789856 RepID=UPI001E503531|nr:polysaccharide biosynthesis/export family protein [Pontivivens ytuae]
MSTLAIMTGALPAAAQATLQPGDVLSMQVIGLPELAVQAPIGSDGRARLPLVGPVDADGETIESLESSVRAAMENEVYRRYDATGTVYFIALAPEDVFLTVAEWRPVFVQGDVARSGAIPYRAGKTVRMIMAESGGLLPGGILNGDPRALERLPDLQAANRRLSLQMAQAEAIALRIEAELSGEQAMPPVPVPSGADATDVQAIRDLESRRLEFSRENDEAARAFLEAAIRQAEHRIRVLEQQVGAQREQVEADAEEAARLQSLLDQGLTQAGRLVDFRRAQLASSTRVLQTESELARVALDRTRLLDELSRLDTVRDGALLAELSETRANLREIGISLQATQEEMASLGVIATPSSEPPETVITLFRDGEEMPDVTLDSEVLPGDVVEIRSVMPEPTLVGAAPDEAAQTGDAVLSAQPTPLERLNTPIPTGPDDGETAAAPVESTQEPAATPVEVVEEPAATPVEVVEEPAPTPVDIVEEDATAPAPVEIVEDEPAPAPVEQQAAGEETEPRVAEEQPADGDGLISEPGLDTPLDVLPASANEDDRASDATEYGDVIVGARANILTPLPVRVSPRPEPRPDNL